MKSRLPIALRPTRDASRLTYASRLALCAFLAALAACTTVAPAVVGTGIGSIPGDTPSGTLIEIESSVLYEIF